MSGGRLTDRQRAILSLLPDSPSDGRYLKGPALRVADRLIEMGLARGVGRGTFAGRYYVRTDAGRSAIASPPPPPPAAEEGT